jgi:hypothetical protein
MLVLGIDTDLLDAPTALKWMQFGMIATAFATFCATMLINAPYGRYPASKGWGPKIPARFAWFLMECPNLIIPLAVYLHYSTPQCSANYSNNILMCLFVMHYVNRAVLYPLRMSREATPMPLSVAALAFSFTSWNGLMQAVSLGIVNCNSSEQPSWLGSALGITHITSRYAPLGFRLRFNIGVVIFFIGFFINIHADAILLRLSSARRRPSLPAGSTSTSAAATAAATASVTSGGADGDSNGGSRKYSIPEGGMFRYVSCANYFGEIVEWVGFAIASGSWAGTAFALYTFCNLGPRAWHHHLWYHTKFDHYEEKKRKAVIPFVW